MILIILLYRPVFSFKDPSLPWIDTVNDIAKSGRIQYAVLFFSLVWLLVRFAFQRRAPILSTSKTSAIKWLYELPSQVLRFLSFIFIVEASVRKEVHRASAALVAYAVILGLFRLTNDLRWRVTVLHQVNLALLTAFLLLVLSRYLPCIQTDNRCENITSVVYSAVTLAAALVLAAVTPPEWIPPQLGVEIQGYEPATEPSKEENSSFFSYYLSYTWLDSTIWKGTTGKLDLNNVPAVAWYDEPLFLVHRIHFAREFYKKTMGTTFHFMRRELARMSFWVGLAFIIENSTPYAMYRLLAYIADPTDDAYNPYLWVAMLFIGPMSRSVCFQQYLYESTRLMVRIKSAMTQELYAAALASMELEDDPFENSDSKDKDKGKKTNSSAETQKSTSSGRLASLMAADVDAIHRGRDIVMVLIGVPVGTIISFIGLYKMLGWPSLVGMAVLVLGLPISALLSKLMFYTQRKVRKAQDARLSLVTEYLGSIRAIKYFAWEKPITEKIVKSRQFEQKSLWSMALLQIGINQVTQGFPLLALVVTFAFYVGVAGNTLDASVAFTTVTLMKSIRRNIMMASGLARSFAGSLVAFGRLDKYFESTVPLQQHAEGPLRISKANFRKTKKATFILEDIDLDFVEGGLNVITGQSGSGKTTLLQSILGETYLESGSVTVPADIAYASQTAWLQNDTIQNNVLFGQPLDIIRYHRILNACCLNIDLKELAQNDQTVVGENGTSLSGGQRARVALARALYSQAPLILLDDIFSALDAKTSAGVWKRCFCSDLLKGRTVVLVTQLPWISEQADFAIELEKGQVISQEAQIGVVRKPITIAEILGGDDDDDETEDIDTPAETELASTTDALNDPAKTAEVHDANELVDQESKATGRVGRLTCKHSFVLSAIVKNMSLIESSLAIYELLWPSSLCSWNRCPHVHLKCCLLRKFLLALHLGGCL